MPTPTTGRPEDQASVIVHRSATEAPIFAATDMETLCPPGEWAAFAASRGVPFHVFTETRDHAVRRFDGVPRRWVLEPERHQGRFEAVVRPGEFFVFQIAVFSDSRALRGLRPVFEDGNNGGACNLTTECFTCFNTGGVDFTGKRFLKPIDVPAGHLQPLWIGVQIPVGATGTYRGVIHVEAGEVPVVPVEVCLRCEGLPLANGGEEEEERLTRLRWLDSRIGLDDESVPTPYVPITRSGNVLSLLGRDIELAPSGLPRRITSYFENGNRGIGQRPRPLLVEPPHFVIERDGRAEAWTATDLEFTRTQAGRVEWIGTGGNPDGFELSCRGELEFDGYMCCRLRVRTLRDLNLDDIRFEMTHGADAAMYFVGLGHDGGTTPEHVDWRWDATRWQDGYWIGAVEGGLKVRFSDDRYRTPLLNCYYNFRQLALPESWHNGGKGGIRLDRTPEGMRAAATSGARRMRAGEELEFCIEWWITPFKPLDTRVHWDTRFFHPHIHSCTPGQPDCYDTMDFAAVRSDGANTVNVHHGVGINPIINYPYNRYSFEKLHAFVAKAHAAGVRVCLYYTTRELTVHIPEFWAFFGMNGDIVCPGPGVEARPITNRNGPHPWLNEHLRENFIPAWSEVIKSGELNGLLDLSVITTPDSRLENYFLEGLRFILERCPIDGLYIDDASLSRKGFQRARRIFGSFGKPDAVIDFHAWNACIPCGEYTFGFSPVVYRDLHNFPYFTRLWLGESFDYTTSPDYWLVEISGIPFGLMGEMLQRGGNPWRGLIYGMTNRLGWYGDPRAIWRLWDEWELGDAVMLGYWDADCPVRTDHPGVLATVYVTDRRVVVAIASWSKEDVEVKLTVDTAKLPGRTFGRLAAPEIEGFQRALEAGLDQRIKVEPGKGWMLELRA